MPLTKLPNAFRGEENAQPVDSWPWIWNELKELGYKTMYIEDMPDIGTFQYRMMGFNKQPTNFYGRNFYLLLKQLGIQRFSKSYPEGICLGGRKTYSILLDYIREFIQLNGDPVFHFSISDELTHNDNSLV